jgi:hypothetical protein
MAKHDKDRKRMKQSHGESRPADPSQADAGEGHGHQASKAHGRPATVDRSLPSTRDELIGLHAAARRRRADAALDSPEYRAAVEELGRIEIRIADVERSLTPPRG